jgi:predicted nucleic acid-binding protein
VRTAIDTNILSALWSNETGSQEVLQQLGDARSLGALLIAPTVYAELLAYPKATAAFLDRFLSDTAITADFQLDESVWVDAGRRFARYAGHRR